MIPILAALLHRDRTGQHILTPDNSWEKRCRRCGLCCYEKTIIGNEVVYDLDSWCEHFDPETKSCRIYASRLTEQVRCRRVTRFKAMFAAYLPPECGYVKWAISRRLRFAPHRRIRYIHSKEDDPDSYAAHL